MTNEFIFLFHTIVIMIFTLGTLILGQSALITSIVIQSILANLFITKQITLFGLNVTCTDVFAVGSMFSLTLLQEFYGNQATKKAIALSFFTITAFLIFSQFQIWYKPSSFDLAHASFLSILNLLPRITIASVISYTVSQICAGSIFSLLKILLNTRFCTFRSITAILTGQLIDTILFSFAALYGVAYSICDVIIFSLTIKTIIILLLIPFTMLLKIIFKNLNNNEN